MADYHIPDVNNPQEMKEFMDFFRNDIANPPKVADLFKIPEGLSPDWQRFFDKVKAYHEVQCAGDRHALISLEKRSWVMEDDKLSEFEMLASATDLKEQGNAAFKQGDIAQAQVLYSSSISLFPTPDTMNNMAAACLKANRFDMAESFATKALGMDLFTNPSSSAKAHFRRSTARLHMANFEGAREDVLIAQQFNPSDLSIKELPGRIRTLCDSINTPQKVKKYLEEQPQPAAKVSFKEGLNQV